MDDTKSEEDNDEVSNNSFKEVVTSNHTMKDIEVGEESDKEGEEKAHFSGATSAKKRSSQYNKCANYADGFSPGEDATQNGWSSDEDKDDKDGENGNDDHNDKDNDEDIFDGSNDGDDKTSDDNDNIDNQWYVGHSNSSQNKKGVLMATQAFRSDLLVKSILLIR